MLIGIRSRNLAIGIAAVLLLGGISPAQGQTSIELLFTGQFGGPGPYPESGQRWLAVSRDERGLALVETTIEINAVPDGCSGTATRVTAQDVDEPLFLVRGSPQFQPGPLETVFDEPRFIFPAEFLSIQLESGQYFGLTAYGSAVAELGGTIIHDYEIVVRRGPRTQTLATFSRIGLDGPPRLIWVGDLDGDGYADALLDLTKSYAGHLYVLFISSSASAEQLVERVAEFRVSGC